MNLYQVGYYRKDAGNVVTFVNSIIVQEKKNGYFELITDRRMIAVDQMKPVKEGISFILNSDISNEHLVDEKQAIAYLQGNKKAVQKFQQQLKRERGELRGFEKIKARARQLFK